MRGRLVAKRLLFYGFAFYLLSFICLAQAPVGQILGSLRDPSGAIVPGASITVTNLGTSQHLDTKTNEVGDYLIRELTPGEYSVTASAPGFQQVVRTPVTLVAFQNARVDLTLQIGGVTSEAQVLAADVPQVDTRSNTLGDVVDTRTITEMPINNRNVVALVNLTPGVEHVSQGDNVNRNQQRLNIAGNRAYSTNMQLDGGSMYFAHRGQGIELPPPDAIEEVQVVTSGMSAEYGRGTAVFAAVTKSGSNDLHGTAWELLRNDAFDSRPFFTPAKPMLRAHDFGATIGGPIIKDRLFFFGSYQGSRVHQNVATSTPFPPTAAERQGDFSADNPKPIDPQTGKPFLNGRIDPSRFDPVAVKILAMVPQPNLPSGALSITAPQPTSGDSVVGKFDFTATEKDRLSFRWFFDYRRGIMPFPANPVQSVPGYSPAPNTQDPKSATLNYVRTWAPSVISTTRASFTKWVYDEGNSVHKTLADLGAINFQDQYGQRLPTITVNGRFSATATTNDERVGIDYNFAHDWDWIHNGHDVKWGAWLERNYFNHPNSSNSAGTFIYDGSLTGNTVADFLLGTPVNFTQSTGNFNSGHYYLPAFYGQDTWKASRRLTLTLGLRWEIYTAWREDSGQDAMFIPGVQSKTFPKAPLGMVFQNDPEYTYHTAWKNFGPRLGFAWDVFGNGRTSVRGGYGISYDGLVAEPLMSGQQPFSLSVTVNNPGPLSDPYRFTKTPFPYVVNPTAAVFKTPLKLVNDLFGHFRPMYNQSINLTVERQLAANWALQVSYVTNLSRHGFNGTEENPAIYRPGATTRDTDARRIYTPLYSSMIGYTSNLNTSYNALQTLVTKRLSHGFTFQGHYTWSKAIDQCSTEVIGSCRQQVPFNPSGDRALGDFDRPHVAVISYIYELPKFASLPHLLNQVAGGWQIASYHVFQSGNPFTVFTGSDASLSGVGNDRPNLVGNPVISGDRSNADKLARWFNPAAFVANSPGTFGNVGRNTLRAPDDVRWDISFKKVFYAYEKYRLELRSDVNNVMNHTVFDAPGNSLASPKSFGVISSTVVSGRVIRLGLHLDF